MVHHCCLVIGQCARGLFNEFTSTDRVSFPNEQEDNLNGNPNIAHRELWQESSEIRISPSFGLPVVLRTSTSTQTITVQQPGHIQHSTRQTSSVQPVISSTKYPASKVPEDKQETPDLQTRTTVSLHPTSFSRAVSSSSRPSRPSTSRRDHDNAIFGVLSIVREPVPEPPPTTIFKTKQDPTASRFVSVDLTSKSNLIPEFRTSIMDTMTLIANLNVDPLSPSTSGALVFDLETSSLDSFENVTSTSKKSTWASPIIACRMVIQEWVFAPIKIPRERQPYSLALLKGIALHSLPAHGVRIRHHLNIRHLQMQQCLRRGKKRQSVIHNLPLSCRPTRSRWTPPYHRPECCYITAANNRCERTMRKIITLTLPILTIWTVYLTVPFLSIRLVFHLPIGIMTDSRALIIRSLVRRSIPVRWRR